LCHFPVICLQSFIGLQLLSITITLHCYTSLTYVHITACDCKNNPVLNNITLLSHIVHGNISCLLLQQLPASSFLSSLQYYSITSPFTLLVQHLPGISYTPLSFIASPTRSLHYLPLLFLLLHMQYRYTAPAVIINSTAFPALPSE
jgi:hypothetical protein